MPAKISASRNLFHPGFSLLEVILAVALFVIMVSVFVGALVYGQQSTAISGARNRALLLAEEGLEAARNLRDDNFANLVDGNHGLSVSGNQWAFSGTQDSSDIFTRQLQISTVNTNLKNITSSVSWQESAQRSGNVSLSTQLSNWQRVQDQYLSFNMDISGAHIGSSGKDQLQGLIISNSGTNPITIDKVTTSWVGQNQNLQAIKINNILVWSKDGPGTPAQTQPNGQTENIVDFTLNPGGSYPINYFDFTGNMTGTIFSMTFTFGDGTQKTINNINRES